MLPHAPAAPRTPAPLEPGVAEFAVEDVVMPRFHVWTLGCQMNVSDSEEMAGALLAAGCAEAASMESADLVVINSCAIRETAEQKIIGRQGHLARLKAVNPGLRVVLTGCAVRDQGAAGLARRYPSVDLFLRPDQEPELAARLGLAGPTAPGRLGETRARAVAGGQVARASAWHAWLPIIYGCDKTCTYCIVPFSRGPERSRPFDEIVDEARALAASGYREVSLLGQNVNSYGHDLPPDSRFAGVRRQRTLGRRIELDGRPDIAGLLRTIDGIRAANGAPAIPRLRFITSHPWDLGDRLVAAMAECPSVCEHLHLPVQSGSDEVLRRMGRQYAVESYLELVDRLRAAVPGISLTTDVIVGFCGETEEQFEATLGLLERVGYDTVYAAAFSPRPGTPAARLADDVPPAEKKRRLNALLAFQERIGLDRHRAWVGRTVEVLADEIRPRRAHEHEAEGEGTAAPLVSGPGQALVRLAGRDRAYHTVHFDGAPDLLGRIVRVRIERAGPYSLSGALAGTT
jgi:tRNA-2-methylthio-N6-dimethylallyladenosine synthase